jgi:outer membrane lipoprotein carrier protein
MTHPISRTLLAALFLLLNTTGASAAGLPAYAEHFFSGLTTLQADFEQTVTDANQKSMQDSKGHMWIERPGKFRWDYHTPYEQELVADGQRVWSYDADLEQVTVQQASEVLTSTPAMLLSGTTPLDKVFNIEESGANSLLLKPKNDDSNITELRLVFAGNMLSSIVAHDSFGNTTTFHFSQMARNEPVAAKLFQFVPPPGTDVIGTAR